MATMTIEATPIVAPPTLKETHGHFLLIGNGHHHFVCCNGIGKGFHFELMSCFVSSLLVLDGW